MTTPRRFRRLPWAAAFSAALALMGATTVYAPPTYASPEWTHSTPDLDDDNDGVADVDDLDDDNDGTPDVNDLDDDNDGTADADDDDDDNDGVPDAVDDEDNDGDNDGIADAD